MKVLVSCYACSPYKGSEPGMGWNFVHCLAPMHELHIITESKYEDDLRRYFAEHPDEEQLYHFYFIPRKRFDILRKIWPPSYYWFYRLWQRKVLTFAKQLDKRENFDVIHALNMAGYREPGFLYKLDKPIVWGPVGGFCISPWCLLPSMGGYGMLYYGARNLINIWQMHFKATPRRMAHRADAIIAATQDNHDAIVKLWDRDSVIIPEVGLIESRAESVVQERDRKLRICWSGQHTPAKTLNLLIEALALAQNRQSIELHVIGQGKSTNRWKRLAERLGLGNIIWHGWVERDEAWRIMKQSHVFCITSVADLTSSVLLEALSFGLPVITLDLFGFSNVVTDSCGVKIPVRSHSQVVADLVRAIDRLADNETERCKLAQGALARSAEFTWINKAKIINDIYNQVLSR